MSSAKALTYLNTGNLGLKGACRKPDTVLKKDREASADPALARDKSHKRRAIVQGSCVYFFD